MIINARYFDSRAEAYFARNGMITVTGGHSPTIAEIKMENKQRSKAFIKIKHTIEKSTNSDHLVSCRQMIENATPILSKDELVILKEYMLNAWDKVNPVARDWEEDSIESIHHKRLAAQ